jgi:hypothetical protein
MANAKSVGIGSGRARARESADAEGQGESWHSKNFSVSFFSRNFKESSIIVLATVPTTTAALLALSATQMHETHIFLSERERERGSRESERTKLRNVHESEESSVAVAQVEASTCNIIIIFMHTRRPPLSYCT